MRMRRTVAFVALLALCSGIAVTTAPSDAASGLAWDQVMKFSMDGSVPEPNFAQDWQTASQPAPQQQRGGMFGAMAGQINGAMAMAQSLRTGMAERHFAAGNLERTDNIAAQTATIVDCGARTITYLDLAKKTYRVVSMDQPQTAPRPGSGGPRESNSPMQDDGTRFKVAYTSQALGPKSIDGVNTDGYKAAMTITITKSDGSSQTMTTDMTQYLSSYGEPAASCPAGRRAMAGLSGGGGAGMAAMMSSMNTTRMMNDAMRTPSGDQRFTFSSTGPPLPAGRLDMFSVYQTQAQNSQGRSFAMILERGNVHPVSDTDRAVFGIPPDFTQEK
jgi:hypothetical protein